MGVPFCSEWWYARISVCFVHYTSLMADHLGKAASEAAARTHDPLAFMDAPACLTQDDRYEIFAIHPTNV